jgi:hypothetical protein
MAWFYSEVSVEFFALDYLSIDDTRELMSPTIIITYLSVCANKIKEKSTVKIVVSLNLK